MSDLQEVLRSIIKPALKIKTTFDDKKITMAVILDEFSTACFTPEANLIPLGTEDFERALDHFEPDLFLCESAWRGNGNVWTGEIAGTGEIKPRLEKLIQACRQRGIPTVFWNKEDPPHFNEFIGSAKNFDIIFTTEERMIPKYKAASGHERVYTLPFGAQPKLHNPLQVDHFRGREIAFAGQYFTHKFPKRREQTDFLFSAAKDFDFHIHSREQTGDVRYRFPEQYEEFLRGSLPYELMVDAYKWYKVYLNVNSVHDSQTMCARRVFELSACKTVVLSAVSDAVRNYYSVDAVPMASNTADARAILKALLDSDSKRTKMAHRAWRETMQSHTYAQRMRTIRRACLELSDTNENEVLESEQVAAVLLSNDIETLEILLKSALEQTTKFDAIILPFASSQTRVDLESRFTDIELKLVGVHDTGVENTAKFVVFSQGFDYGERYAEDLLYAFEYGLSRVIGKPVPVGVLTTCASRVNFDCYADKASVGGLAFEGLATGSALGLFDRSILKRSTITHENLYLSDPFNFKPTSVDVLVTEWDV